mgnify:CR=1 FL=1
MNAEFNALVEGRHNNPFAVLGPHQSGRGRVVRTYQPGAKTVELVERNGDEVATMRRVHKGGLYEAALPPRNTLVHLDHTLRTLQAWRPASTTDTAQTLHRIAASIRRRAMVVLCSDLFDDEEEVMKALEWAKRTGRARFTGISSHDRPHIKEWIDRASDQLEVIVTPYTAKTKMTGAKIEPAEEGDSTRVVRVEGASWEDTLWYAMQKHDVGWFGIKPFASNSIFKGDSSPGNPHQEADNKIARLTLRAILTNPVITAPIPGLITEEQVDNAALAVALRRELDVEEQAELDAATERAFANLPDHYQWLKNWEYV